jgi:hypothetical protein
MNATYRIVHFVPDPFSGWRVPVAALVQVGAEVRVVPSPMVPGPASLGGRPAAALFRMIAASLSEVRTLDRLPAGAGPQAFLDVARTAPVAGLDAAAAWIASHVLPQHVPVTRAAPLTTHAPPRRMHGTRFFETWHVATFVKPTFEPASDWDGRLGPLAAYGDVSHWVGGRDDLLLLEPIVPSRAKFAEDLEAVAKVFGAYRFALSQLADTASPTLIAYVLGGSDERKQDAATALGAAAHRVVDTDDPVARRHFLDEIRAVGRSGDEIGDRPLVEA